MDQHDWHFVHVWRKVVTGGGYVEIQHKPTGGSWEIFVRFPSGGCETTPLEETARFEDAMRVANRCVTDLELGLDRPR